MRIPSFLALLGLALIPVAGFAQPCEWARAGRSGANGYHAQGVDVDRDAAGNIYVVGAFDSVFTLLGQTVVNLFPGRTGTVVCRFTPEGALTWMRKIDGNTFIPAAIAVQGSEIMIAGSYQNNMTVSFAPGGPVNFSGQGVNGILLKLDTDGNYLLGRNFMSPNNAFLTDVLFLGGTAVLFTGRFRQSLSIAGTTFNVTGPNASNTYGFYGRMHTNGTVEWLKISGNAGNYCEPTALATEAGGNFYLAGVYRQGLAFGNLSTPAPGSNLATLPFLARFNAGGDPLWVQGSVVPAGSAALASFCTDVRLLGNGQVMVTGGFNDRVTFLGLTSSAGHSAFAIRVQNSGALVSSHLVESNQTGNRYQFARQDGAGNIWLGGEVRGTITIRNNGLVHSQGQQTSGTDMLLAHFQGGTNFDGIALLGGSGNDRLSGGVLDASGRLYTTGSFTGNFSLAGTNFTSSGSSTSDLLLARICSFSTVTSTEDPSLAGPSWGLWPNPARDFVHLELPESSLPFHYTLMDLFGRTVQEGQCPGGGRQMLPLDVPASGNYYLRLTQDGRHSVQSLQVIH